MSIFGNLNNLYLQANKSNKFSNDTLFGRRETEYSSKGMLFGQPSRINSGIKRPYSSTIQVSLFNNDKNKILRRPQKKYSYFKTESKSAFKRLFHEEDYFHKSSRNNNSNKFKSFIKFERFYNPNNNLKNLKHRKNLSIMSNVCTDNLNYVDTIYLTETNIKKNTITTKDLITNPNYENSLTITNYNYNKYQNADILNKFMKDKIIFNKNEDLKEEYKDKTTKTKNSKINRKRESINEFREKIRQQKLFKFSIQAKEELCIRIKEKYQNELGYITDKIESFNTWKKLDQDFFSNKIDEYLKFLMYQKSYEKNKVEDLLDEIIRLKNDITKINSQMAKIELDKSKILRWIYFQIQLKEKKVTLPSYYNLILENINDINAYYDSKIKKLSNSYFPKSPESNKSIKNLSLSVNKKKDKMKKSIKKSKVFSGTDSLGTPILKIEIMNLLNKKEGKEAYLRIKEYKNNLIYNLEDFKDRMNSLQRDNLRLINYRTELNYKIQELKTQYNKVNEENNKIFEFYNYNLNKKLNELNRLKINNSTMENIIKIFHSLNYYYKNKNKEKTQFIINGNENEDSNDKPITEPIALTITKNKPNKSKNKNKKKLNKKMAKELLFIKVKNLYNMCKSIKFKEPKHYEILKEKEKIMKNFGVLFHIFYIEYCVNYLIDYSKDFEKNNKDGKKKMRKILFEIEKAHREEKAEELRIQRNQKYINLEKEIKKRYDRVNLQNNKFVEIVVKKKKPKIKVKKENKIPTFEDFVIDDSFEDKNEYHYISDEEKKVK